uniref:Uncharacterized protein n=1 Tax=Molossus molossus TaxID=27622 RepID=A0A7J8HBW1_MOLMO|nr:hypothetical protein HJG59_011191 [Molossus molossus]
MSWREAVFLLAASPNGFNPLLPGRVRLVRRDPPCDCLVAAWPLRGEHETAHTFTGSRSECMDGPGEPEGPDGFSGPSSCGEEPGTSPEAPAAVPASAEEAPLSAPEDMCPASPGRPHSGHRTVSGSGASQKIPGPAPRPVSLQVLVLLPHRFPADIASFSDSPQVSSPRGMLWLHPADSATDAAMQQRLQRDAGARRESHGDELACVRQLGDKESRAPAPGVVMSASAS